MTRCVSPTSDAERATVQAFRNFLSWGEKPSGWRLAHAGGPPVIRRSVPPAWYAYTLGATTWCPPAGEL